MLYIILIAMALVLVVGAGLLIAFALSMFFQQQPEAEGRVDLHSLTSDNHPGRGTGGYTMPTHDDDDDDDEGGATEVFSRDTHGGIAGWKDDDDDEAEKGDGATQLFNKESMEEYADYLDDDDSDEYEDEDDGLPGRVVADDED